VFNPDEKIEALVNLGKSTVKKVTMSLYIMVEIKDPEENNQTLS
jgi:hypothetical protein